MDNCRVWLVTEMLSQMPDNKKVSLQNCCRRNDIFTTEYIPSYLGVEVYREGFRITLEGCQCSFSVWAFDRDGVFEFGRMPSRKTLHYLGGETYYTHSTEAGIKEVCEAIRTASHR